jgi:hypothetical protein
VAHIGIGRRHARTGAWFLLLFIPAALAAVFVAPPFGAQGQGWLSEMLGNYLAFTTEYDGFALEMQKWGGALFGVSILVGILFWSTTKSAWQVRLRTLDAKRVFNYRGLAFTHTALAAVVAASGGCALLLLSQEPKAMPLVNWFIFAGCCAALAALQHFVTIFGVTHTRRLYRGI